MTTRPRFSIVVGRGGNIYEARESLQVEVDALAEEGYEPNGPITIQTGTEPQEQESGRYGLIQFRLPDLKIVHLSLVMSLPLPAKSLELPSFSGGSEQTS